MSFPIRSLPVLLASFVGCERESEPQKEVEESEQDLKLCACRGERGPAGPQGPQGPRGPRGFRGPEGPEGPSGQDGVDGTSCFGESVAEGVQITCGEDTYTIRHGERGEQGPMGPQGPQGERGEPGPAALENFRWNAHTIAGRWNVDYYHRSGNLIESNEINFNEDGTVTPHSVPPFFQHREEVWQRAMFNGCPEFVTHEDVRDGMLRVGGLFNASITYQINEVPGVDQIFSFVLTGQDATTCCGDLGGCQPPGFVPHLSLVSLESNDSVVVSSDENRITLRAGNGYGVLTR